MLQGFRALDLTDQKGCCCGEILADLGAEVIKVEQPPTNSDNRSKQDVAGSENNLFRLAFGVNKKGIPLNLKNAEGKELFACWQRAGKSIRLQGLKSRKLPEVSRLAKQLEGWLDVTHKVMHQTEEVISGHVHLKNRLVSCSTWEFVPSGKASFAQTPSLAARCYSARRITALLQPAECMKVTPLMLTYFKSAVSGHRRLFRKSLRAVTTDRDFLHTTSNL